MACLVYTDAAGREEVFPLDGERVTIGRSPDNDLVSTDMRVSRHHAAIIRSPSEGTYTLRDEGSSMGVFLNQQHVTEALLRDGDMIKLGDTIYSFVDLPTTALESLSSTGHRGLGSADLRGGALVAELREAVVSLRSTVQRHDAEPRILDQCLSAVEARLEGLRQHLVRIERARMMMQTLYEVGKTINSSTNRANLQEIILELAVKVVGAERGFLTLYDREEDAVKRRAAIKMDKDADGGQLDFCSGIALSVARTGEPVVTTDAQVDDRFKERQSVVNLNIRSALCVPLLDRAQEVLGVIYVDTRASVVMFGPEDREFLMAFANYAAIAIENATLAAEAAAKARMEEELRQARVMDEMKSDLISMVSHDVRTPLTSIKSYAEILTDDLDSLDLGDRQRFLDIINSEADRLSRLVTNLLDLEKIEAGMMKLALDSVDVNELIDEGLDAFRGMARGKGVALARHAGEAVPALKGDRDRLLQVLANLLSNAIKFTPAGGSVAVSARPAELPDGRIAVEIGVKDTGEGIPPDRVDALFRRFSQIGPDRRQQKSGSGLGLVFSRQIVELHGGTIRAESVPGKGATFIVVLPVEGS